MWNLASRYVAATAVLVSAAAAVTVNQRSGEESAMTLKPEVVGKDRLLRTKRHAFSTLYGLDNWSGSSLFDTSSGGATAKGGN